MSKPFNITDKRGKVTITTGDGTKFTIHEADKAVERIKEIDRQFSDWLERRDSHAFPHRRTASWDVTLTQLGIRELMKHINKKIGDPMYLHEIEIKNHNYTGAAFLCEYDEKLTYGLMTGTGGLIPIKDKNQ